MDRAEVIKTVNESMVEGFEIPANKLLPDALLFEDLELDSLDAVDMMVTLEERLDIKVDAEQFREVRNMDQVYDLIFQMIKDSKFQN